MILVVILYALLAATFLLAKKAIMYANPCFLIGFRMICAGLVLVGYQAFVRKGGISIPRADWWLFFKASLFHIYFAFTLEFWALQYVTALKTTLIYSLTPFVAALLAFFLLHERLSLRKMVGIIVGMSSLIPVVAMKVVGPEAAFEWARISLPEIALLGSVFSATYAWFIVKQLIAKDYSLSMINGVAMFVGGVLSMTTASIVEGFAHPVSNWPYFFGWVAALIVVANIIVYNLYGLLLKRYSITFLTFAGFLCPSFGTLYEWLFLSGVVTWQHAASLVLIIIGLYIFYRDEMRG